MDKVTKRVKDQYQQYPFPSIEYNFNLPWYTQILEFFKEKAPSGKNSYLEDINILDAGCGTASTILKIAETFPSSLVTGVDVSSTSLDFANKQKEERDLTNINFLETNILKMDLKKKFDVIINIGVLHHLSNMELGLKNIVKHLTPQGYIVFWIYGEHGRYHLNLKQRFFKTLLSSVDDLARKLELTKNVLNDFPKDLIKCNFDVPHPEITGNFSESLKFILGNEEWLMDQFLHVNENVFNIESIQELFSKADLKIEKWLGINTDICSYTNNKEIHSLFKALSNKEKLLCLDLLNTPRYYLLIANRN